jgi:hypothetical protein
MKMKMNIGKKYLQSVMVTCLLISGSGASAAGEWVSGNVSYIYTDSALFGNCMVHITGETSLSCPQGWFSLGCAGDYMSKQVASRNYDMAQMAFVMETPINLWVQDSLKYNGYCVATGIYVGK